MFAGEMKEVSTAIARWLAQKRRTDQTIAAVLSVLGLIAAAFTFFVTALSFYLIFSTLAYSSLHSSTAPLFFALGIASGLFLYGLKSRMGDPEAILDPGGIWIFKEICSISPRLLIESVRQVRLCGRLGEMNVAACAQALVYLARHNSAVKWEELVRCCPLSSARLREQLSLLHGVLFLGADGMRVTLMGPFRLRLRAMLQWEPRHPEPEPEPTPTPEAAPVNEPEMLGAYEILGLSPKASASEIKAAYRKRVKECHPDLFAGMDDRARALAERWTRALNAAYATLNPRNGVPHSSKDRKHA